MNKNMKMMWLIVGMVVLVAALWWWMSRPEMVSAPTTPTPAAQTDPEVEALNSIDASQDLDAEFKGIDQDLNNL